ncbi:MAG: cytochrome ubiquinol oxidase subunit I [Verrucomicrobiae bacterium]|nr:cytochrome ubiquinol oxidase subunit I [Verrucomicrobiae bacterium]
MNVETLSRIQFALTISFHFVFPPMTIGLGLVLVVLQTLRVRTGNPLYLDLARFWTRVFGLIFAIGVATGIPMEFQFGTNWASYARFVGDIFGSPLAIEGLYAFFMESGFLALLLFGWDRIGPRMHLFSTCMVALGAHFSAIWILVANSWMQTPAGYHLARMMKVTADGGQFPVATDLGAVPFELREIRLPPDYVVQPEDLGHVRAVVDNFREAILNPSTLDRLAHTVIGCWITGAFVVVAISAWWCLRGRHPEHARISLKIGVVLATVACVLQWIAADSTARGVARNQPTKLAAMEGLATTGPDASLGLVGWVSWRRDASGEITGIEERSLRIPGMLSVLVSGDFLHPLRARDTVVTGLQDLPSDALLRARHPGASDAEIARLRPRYWPNAPVLFQTYHLMIALGSVLTGQALLACLWWRTGRLWAVERPEVRWFLISLLAAPLMAQLALQAGWFTAEMGRQPWVVYEVLKTGDAVSPVVRAPQVLTSILLFLAIYAVLSILFVTLLLKKIREGPVPSGGGPPTGPLPLSHRSGRQTGI